MKRGQEALLRSTRQMREKRIDHDLKMCWKKKRYTTSKFAEGVADKVFAERKVALRVYFCPICSGYHLTHKPDRIPR